MVQKGTSLRRRHTFEAHARLAVRMVERRRDQEIEWFLLSLLEVNSTHSFVLCVSYIKCDGTSKGRLPTFGQAFAAGAIAAIREGRPIASRICSPRFHFRPERDNPVFAAVCQALWASAQRAGDHGAEGSTSCQYEV